MNTVLRYIGRVGSVPKGDNFGFISLASIQREDGGAHSLPTSRDVFVHQDDCSSALRAGMMLSFEAIEAPNRPGDYRAMGAIEYLEGELLPPRGIDPIPGFMVPVPFNPVIERALAQTRLPVHQKMKRVPTEAVEKAIENQPLAGLPRNTPPPTGEEEKKDLLAALLAHLFPSLSEFGADYNVLNFSDERLDELVSETKENLELLGATEHIPQIEADVKSFKDIRTTLGIVYDEGLVRPDTIIPIRFLPDLFMAVPVWFFWADANAQGEADDAWQNDDPRPHASTLFFCDLFRHNRHWADTYQLFNRRLRTLRQYPGKDVDTIPPFVARRMKKAVQIFDYVVIATPYLEMAGRDWQDLDWIKSIDPYVLGFKKGLPYFFVLARFSNTGLFPLVNELVADTMEFLRVNKGHLENFNRAMNPFWYGGSTLENGRIDWSEGDCQSHLGTHLASHVNELIHAFESGRLFDWLRHEEEVSKSRPNPAQS